jgi:hypothetical protein
VPKYYTTTHNYTQFLCHKKTSKAKQNEEVVSFMTTLMILEDNKLSAISTVKKEQYFVIAQIWTLKKATS